MPALSRGEPLGLRDGGVTVRLGRDSALAHLSVLALEHGQALRLPLAERPHPLGGRHQPMSGG